MYEYSKAQFYSLVCCVLLEFREILALADWNRRDIQRKTGKTFFESKTDSKLINIDHSLLKDDYTKRTHSQRKISFSYFMHSWIIIHMLLFHVNIIETWMSKTHFNKKREH